MTILFSAFAIGILGSFHCVGMCGPIALALPTIPRTPQRAISSLVYNMGRLLTYTLLGALFGLIGKGMSIAGFQQTLSIGLGVVMMASVLLPLAWQRRLNPNLTMARVIGWVKRRMKHWLQVRTYTARFVLGSLNGLLPCGLVYLGIAGAIATGDMLQGGLYMLLFGSGTFPAMAIVGFLGSTINLSVRNRIRAAIPVFVFCMGIFFLLRGLALDIPYLSPVLPDGSASSGMTICR
ncbi:MAG: sulfite exporter TauE/SafE family protein [Cyclobacteriaceae bacterium]